MKIDPRIKYYTAKEMRDLAVASIPDELVKDKRTIANEYARKNGFEKTSITISGIRRVYFYKPIK